MVGTHTVVPRQVDDHDSREWIRSIVRRRPDIEQDELKTKLLRTASLMNSAIPDSLIIDQNSVCEAARKQHANLQNPPKTVDQLLDGLEKIGLVKTVEFFRRRREFI